MICDVLHVSRHRVFLDPTLSKSELPHPILRAHKRPKKSCVFSKTPLLGIYLPLFFENAYTKAERDSVLKSVWTLSPDHSVKIEKMAFQYFPKVSQFFSHFSQILWLEISSNPGLELS